VVCIKSYLNGPVTLTLIDLGGKEVLKQDFYFVDQEIFKLSLGSVQRGIYIARLQQGKENSFSKLAIIH